MHIDSFINYIQVEKRYSQHTVIAYKTDLLSFQEFLKKEFNIQDLVLCTHHFIRTWIVSLMNDNVNPKSVNRKLSVLKSFYKFLIRNKVVDVNPMNKIVSPKNPKRLPNYVPENNMNNLISDEIFTENFEGVRDRLIMEMLYNTGVRLSELVGVKIQDVNFIESKVKVLGKRNKERLIPFNQHLLFLLNKYIKLRNNTFIEISEDALLLTNKGKKLYSKFVYRTVNAYLSKVTTISKKSPHVIRHTFATHMLNNGADINAIKELLGHSSLAATQIYTHNSIEKLKNIYKQAHPKA